MNEVKRKTSKITRRKINLPIVIFENRKLTVLEAIVIYLRNQGKKYSEIAKLLNRDQRNVWTVCSRAKNKIGKEINNL